MKKLMMSALVLGFVCSGSAWAAFETWSYSINLEDAAFTKSMDHSCEDLNSQLSAQKVMKVGYSADQGTVVYANASQIQSRCLGQAPLNDFDFLGYEVAKYYTYDNGGIFSRCQLGYVCKVRMQLDTSH